MLMPKRTKYRRPHRISYEGKAKAGTTVNFGEFGLQAIEGGYVTNNQIEAARIALSVILEERVKFDSHLPHLSKTKNL